MRYTKYGRLKTKEAIEDYLNRHGYISIHQAIKIGEKNNILRKSTVGKIFYNLSNVEYITIWNPGNINYFRKIRLCPPLCSTVVAKKIKRKNKNNKQHVTFCVYDGTKKSDYDFMLDILVYKNYKRAKYFPPLLGQYKVIQDEDRRLIFWAEKKDLEVLEEEDLPELMQEFQDDRG